MELNSYQQQVINDLDKYLDKISEVGQYDIAFNQFWEDKVGRYDPINKKGMQPYKNVLKNTLFVCRWLAHYVGHSAKVSISASSKWYLRSSAKSNSRVPLNHLLRYSSLNID